jgi:CRP-like cAMP-binding protein
MNNYLKDSDLTIRSTARGLIGPTSQSEASPIKTTLQLIPMATKPLHNNFTKISSDFTLLKNDVKVNTRRSSISPKIAHHKRLVNENSVLTKATTLDITRGLRTSVLQKMPYRLTMLINDYINNVNANLPMLKNVAKNEIRTNVKKERVLESFQNVYDSISEDENMVIIDDLKSRSRFVIDPNSFFHLVWSFFIFLLVVYSVTITPVVIAFTLDSIILSSLDITVDFVFLTDVVVNFFIPYQSAKDNKYVYKHKRIIINYLTSWFLFDIITSLPTGLIADESTDLAYRNVGKILRLTRLLRLTKWLKVVRLLKLFQGNKVTEIIMNIEIVSILQLNRVFKFTLLLFIMVHISSCLWIYVGRLYDTYTWIINSNLTDADNFSIYISSLYFIMVTILSIGYGDIVSLNIYERLFNLGFMIFGLMFFSFALSTLGSIFSKLDEKSIRLERKLKIVTDIVNEYNVPDALRNKITKTIKHEVSKTGYGKYELIESLPNHLRNILIKVIHGKYMKNLFFLADQPLEFIQFVLPMLRAIPFNQTETLFKEGNGLDEMYLIVKGSLSLTLGALYNNFEIANLNFNSHFGDILLYLGYPSPYNLVTKSKYVEVLVLNRKDFLKLKKTYYSNILSILSQSIPIFELYELRRVLVSEIYKFETNNKNINSILSNLNTYILHKDDEIGQSISLSYLNNFLEKIDNNEINSKFSEIASKLDSDMKNLTIDNTALDFKENSELKRSNTFKRSNTRKTTQIDPYRLLILRMLNINNTHSGIDDKKLKSPGGINITDEGVDLLNGLDLQPLKHDIIEEAKKHPDERADDFVEVRRSIHKLSTQNIKGKIKRKHLARFRKVSKVYRRSIFKSPYRSPNKPHYLSPKKKSIKFRTTLSRHSAKSLTTEPPILKRLHENISPKNTESKMTFTQDSKQININVFNYETNYNQNVIVLPDGKDRPGILKKGIEMADSVGVIDASAFTLNKSYRLITTESSCVGDDYDSYNQIFQKLDEIYFVLSFWMRMRK